MLAVLVASCPCALVLAAPATAIAAIAVAARHGILIKGSGFLEHAAEVSSVVFDKTGTVTPGELRRSRRATAGDGNRPAARLRAARRGLGASQYPSGQPGPGRLRVPADAPGAAGRAASRRPGYHRRA